MTTEGKPEQENKLTNRDFRQEFQVYPDTELSIDYLNHTRSALDPLAADPPDTEEVRKRVAEVPTYESYIENAVEFHNNSTNRQYRGPVTREDFINQRNSSLVEQLNAIINEVKAKVEAGDFNDDSLTKLVFDAADLIKGKVRG